MIIKRIIQKQIEKALFHNKVIIIYGARQVGKTTLVKSIQKNYQKQSAYFNCDEPDIRAALTDKTSTEIKSFFGSKKLIILDEAQRVKNIGLTLKLMVDNFPKTQIIATGSSSFELSDKIKEPLTGRKYEFHLYPFSLKEAGFIYSDLEINRLLDKMMIFGMYPAVMLAANEQEKELKELTKSYLYKDALQYQNIKNPEILEKLLQALALQIGNEVSYNELANLLLIDKNTVANYIRILEQAFIIFRLNPFSRNLRSELKKMRKIYFYDVGIRNALINNLNPLNLRQDVGALWENFMISERLKNNSNSNIELNSYFWRTKQGQEIDYLEEVGGEISTYEFKWKQNKWQPPKAFIESYPRSKNQLINRENYRQFLIN
jgi:hypothetical protein